MLAALLIAALVGLLGSSVDAAQTVCPKCGKVHGSSVVVGDAQAEVHRLVNSYRARYGRPPLTLVNHFGADSHSSYMASRRSMFHGRFAGGENVAVGQRSPQHVMSTWMNSSGHRNNILSGRYTQIDVGRCGNYWTQRFR